MKYIYIFTLIISTLLHVACPSNAQGPIPLEVKIQDHSNDLSNFHCVIQGYVVENR